MKDNARRSVDYITMKTAFFLLLIFQGGSLSSQGSAFLDVSNEIHDYLSSCQVDKVEGMTWAVTPEINDTLHNNYLYSGSPGIILFYLEYYHATKDSIYLELAIKGGDFLIEEIPLDRLQISELGMYTGAAGVAYTFKELYLATHNSKYLRVCKKWMNKLYQHLESSDPVFGNFTEIVYGAAGIGLVALDLARSLNSDNYNDLISICAEYLIQNREVVPRGLRWKMSPDMPYYLDNFSHGTAGIAFFFLKAYEHTGIEMYREIGFAAANYIYSEADEEALVCHHSPGGEDLQYLSWCHGPAGTSRLYYKMFQLTGNKKWKNLMERSALSIIELEIDKNITPGFWGNEGWCCGTVGIAIYLDFMFQLTKDPIYLSFLENLNGKILKSANSSSKGLSWIHAENRRSPEVMYAQTGLMQGAAGFGLYFLRMHYREVGGRPSISLPDEIGL